MDERVYDDTVSTPEGAAQTFATDAAQGARRPAERVALAGLGAVASVCDTANDTFDRFVNRGQRIQTDWQNRADDLKRQNSHARGRFQDFVRTGMNVFLDNLNVPNKSDVDTINVKLNILTRKIDDLQLDRAVEAAGEGVAQPPPAQPRDDSAYGAG